MFWNLGLVPEEIEENVEGEISSEDCKLQDLPPCWGLDIVCGKGTDFNYGPWADRQRYLSICRFNKALKCRISSWERCLACWLKCLHPTLGCFCLRPCSSFLLLQTPRGSCIGSCGWVPAIRVRETQLSASALTQLLPNLDLCLHLGYEPVALSASF